MTVASGKKRAVLARHVRNRRLYDALGNRLVGILHGCLRHKAIYDEHTAWAHRTPVAA